MFFSIIYPTINSYHHLREKQQQQQQRMNIASQVILPINFQNPTQQYANNLINNFAYADSHSVQQATTKITTTVNNFTNFEEELDCYTTTNEHTFTGISPKNSPDQNMNFLNEKFNRNQPYQNLSPIKPSFVK